jgi:hypothetical protein
MKLKHVAAVAAFLAAGAAQATGGALSTGGTTFASLAAAAESWTFDLTAKSFGSLTLFSTTGGGLSGFTLTTATNGAVSGLSVSSFLPYGSSLSFSSLAAGSYKLTVSGALGTGYGINANIAAAPVPEADALVLAIAGVGVAGLLRRRRQA